MRAFIRGAVNGTLGRYGYEVRRKHEASDFLGLVNMGTVIDGGANLGHYTVKVRSQYPEAEIHLFEPTPTLFQGLRTRFAGDKKITCHELALSDSVGIEQFHVSSDPFSSSLLEESSSPSDRGGQTVNVQVTTLDAWFRGRQIQRPLLLKLDVEGKELAALRGAEKLLQQVDYILLEVIFLKLRLGQPTFRDILIFLDDRGFDLVDVYPETLDPQSHRSIWADALFARRSLL